MTVRKHQERIASTLEATGLPWSIEDGHGHCKVRVGGFLVGVVSRCPTTRHPRAEKNLIAQIKRKAADIKGERK